MVVENAFGRLKGRWRCLQKRLDFKLANVPNVVGSCVVLHNICEQFGDACLEEWLEAEQENTPTHPTPTTAPVTTPAITEVQVRDAIMRYLA